MATYWQHKFKCGACGMHFIVCSDYAEWPTEGQTVRNKAAPFCPECGRSLKDAGLSIGWGQEIEGHIFEAVPGKAGLRGLVPHSHGEATDG